MKNSTALVWLLFLLCTGQLYAQQPFNGNFEVLNKNGLPKGWDMTFQGMNTGQTKVDSLIKRQGKYAVSLSASEIASNGVAIDYEIKKKFIGRELILIGSIKTEDITDGYAGLWIRVDDRNQQLEIELMAKQNLKGTNDWKEYIVRLPYDEANATAIHVGAVLTGKGKMWVDSLRLYLDEVPIDLAKQPQTASVSDTLYKDRSQIDAILASPENVSKLTSLGQVWGFLKYYHPAIASGQYNWDAELFKILPTVLKSNAETDFSNILEKWVDGLGKIAKRETSKNRRKAYLAPDYGDLFQNPILSVSLRDKLEFIRDNSNHKTHHYIAFEGAQNPAFKNELNYNTAAYPDAGIRLLALYRYWNIIQYFNPNRNLTNENWNGVLAKYIPEILAANDATAYVQTLTKLVTIIGDSHGFIRSEVFDKSLGKYRLPVDAKYIENKLVVTDLLIDSLNIRENFQIGDVIESINGVTIETLIKKYLPVTSSSNFDAAMRDMVGIYLIRSNEKTFALEITRVGAKIKTIQEGVPNGKIKTDLYGAKPSDQAFKLINDKVGYIQGNKFKKSDLDTISKLFIGTRGLIVDMRGYPIEELIHTVGAYIGTNGRPFVKFTKGSLAVPGRFEMTTAIRGGKHKNPYQGKVIIIVNSVTQSNAEFVTMAFQTAKNVKVIGSTTAGADGNISAISLPAGFKTWISGIGVFYPDGTNAQRAGVKIDRIVKPTIEGVRLGKDELLETAIDMILKD